MVSEGNERASSLTIFLGLPRAYGARHDSYFALATMNVRALTYVYIQFVLILHA
jgi:hypothetical protein